MTAAELVPADPPARPGAGALALRSAASPAPPAPVEGRLERLLAGWLLGYNSPHTRRAYGRDVSGWVRWCAQLEVDPLHAGRVHVDAAAPGAVAQALFAALTTYRRQ